MKLGSSTFVLGAFATLALGLQAQTAITGVTTQLSAAGSSTSEGLTFSNDTLAITGFTTATTTYQATSLANAAYARRNTVRGVTANNSSVWYAGTGTTFNAAHETNYADLLLGNNLYLGSDNTFANGTATNTGNIERLDFVFTGGIIAAANQAFSVWDRGDAGVHDGFKIAAITGWDFARNRPSSYGTLVSVAGNWGATNVIGTQDYALFRYANGDTLTANTAHNELGSQGAAGLVFTMANLGVNPGTRIFGYSIFGNDVNASSNNLTRWTNSGYFPTNTNGDTGSGGIDLLAVNGVMFTAVPEPATYAALIGALTLGFVAFRRFRRR